MNVNCKDYQHQITLLLYDELAEGARNELEAHLRECGACKDAFDSERTMHSMLADDPTGWDVPADLLVESRKALADQLDLVEKKRSWWRIPTFSVVFTPMRLLESAALIAMGLALGVYVSNQQARQVQPTAVNPPSENPAPAIPRNGTISNLQVVNADPVTGQVELAGEVSQPLRFQGQMEDDTVRQLLFSALRDGNNPGSRLKAVEVLSQKPTDESIEEALINALVYDDDAGVRMRALEGLKTFANEQHVQAAFMHTLQNDANAGIRIEAIDALLANPKDAKLAQKLTEATKKDDNPYIRTKVLQFVGTTK
jgi:HEAT repeats/Putative zinc-finger